MVEDFFAWVKEQLSQCTVPPKSKTGQGLQYLVNQELYLKVFLTDGDVPIDNSAQLLNVPSVLSVSERKTGCSITRQMEPLQMLWCTVFLKPLN